MRKLIIVTLVLGFSLTGCGFHLRGQETATLTSVEPIHISGLKFHHPLHRALTKALEQADARLSDTLAGASRLSIRDIRSTRRVLSVDSRNKTVEFELEESFLFSLRSALGSEQISDQRLRTLRINLNPEIEVLGRNREEELLRTDMRAELAQRLVERIAAVR